MSCDRCPCPDVCLELPAYCRWAAKDPPDPVEVRHICDASTRARGAADPVAAYPPTLPQAGNLARSLWGWAVDGFKVASPELQDRRRATCAACPRWVPADRRCILCGCYTEAKITLKAESCPEGRW